MKLTTVITLATAILVVSCASGPRGLRDVDDIADVFTMKTVSGITSGNAEDILAEYSIPFEIPNPFQEGSQGRPGRYDPSHATTLKCTAVLLDSIATEADIMRRCSADSLDEAASVEFRDRYADDNLRPGTFRIRIDMESGFSDKSMDPDHWSLYIENAGGVMIEPSSITASTVFSASDSIYSQYYDRKFFRRLLNREITLYFRRSTFFGQDLFGESNPFIVLVVSRKRKTLARIGWRLASCAEAKSTP